MCRSGSEGNGNGEARRCTCDTSAARRLRRHNATAIQKFADQTTPLMDRSEAKPVLEEVDVEQLTMARINAITDNIKTIKSWLSNWGETELGDSSTLVFEDGTEYVITRKTLRSDLAAIAEEQTVKLGDTINQLVEHRTGITDASIVELDKTENEALQARHAELVLRQAAITAEQKEKWPAAVTAEGRTISSATVLAQAYQDGEAEALAQKKIIDDHNALSTESTMKLSLSLSGKSEEALKLTALKREELIKVLSEMRSLGGSINVAENSSPQAVKVLREVEKIYPSDWVDASNAEDPFRAKVTTSRAHYSGGKWQNSYKVSQKRRMMTKKASWEPDPTNKYEAGEWIKIENGGEWTDPITNITYSAASYNSDSEQTWVYSPLEYSYRLKDINDNLVKPKGKGWKVVQIVERKLDHETMQISDGELISQYARLTLARTLVESSVQAELTISGKGAAGYRVGLHEFAHRVESSGTRGRYIESIEEAHIKRRTTDADGIQQPLQQIYKGTKEYGRPDNFTNLYMGKEYKDGFREILSTGAESVFSDSFGSLIGLGANKPDPEMKSLIIGLWASA